MKKEYILWFRNSFNNLKETKINIKGNDVFLNFGKRFNNRKSDKFVYKSDEGKITKYRNRNMFIRDMEDKTTKSSHPLDNSDSSDSSDCLDMYHVKRNSSIDRMKEEIEKIVKLKKITLIDLSMLKGDKDILEIVTYKRMSKENKEDITKLIDSSFT
jgi:hypothetical protein